MKKVCFVIVVLLTIITQNIGAVITGHVGDSITWNFNEQTGHLDITGHGELKRESWMSYAGVDYYMFTDFQGFADKIKTVTISEGITRIVQRTFLDCVNLVSVSLPNSLESMDDFAFSGCSSLSTITIPEGLKRENVAYGGSNDPFWGCKSLKHIIWNAVDFEEPCMMFNYLSIQDSWSYNRDRIEDIIFGDKVKKIPNTICSGMTGLEEVVIPASVEIIGNGAFDGAGIKKVILNEGIKEIGPAAFRNTNLSEINLPESVEIIGADALDASGIKQLYIPKNVQSYYGGAKGIEKIIWDAKDCKSVNQIQFYNLANFKALEIGPNVRKLPDFFMYYCNSLEEVEIPENVEEIGDYCFMASSTIRKVDLSKSNLKKIGTYAICMCDRLDSIIIQNVDTICELAIFSDNSLKYVEIQSVKSIGEYGFAGDPIEKLILPADLELIDNYAFANITAKAEVTCYAEDPPELGELVFGNEMENKTLYVEGKSIAKYKADSKWGEFKNIVAIPGSEQIFTVRCEETEGGRISGEGNFEEGKECELTATADEGYEFLYWQKEDGSTIQDNPYKFVVNGKVSLKAVFQKKSFNLKYIVDGEIYKESVVEFGETINVEDDPEKEGYTFSGWSEIPDSMPAHDVCIYGYFNKNTYTLKYVLDDEVFECFELEYGASIEYAHAVPQKTGFTFSGWKGLSDLPKTMPAHDVIIIGSYLRNKHVIYYVIGSSEGGIVHKEDSVFYDYLIEPAEYPVKEGYTFSGWNNLPDRMPDDDLMVWGNFTVNRHYLRYMVDGELYKEVLVSYGSEMSIWLEEPAPYKSGYNFCSWSDCPDTMPDSDVSIEAVYEKSTFEVRYWIDGELYWTDYVEYEEQIPEIDKPSKYGYDFSGWSEVPDSMPAHFVDVYGSWIKRVHQVQYYVDGTFYISEEYGVGDVIIVLPDLQKDGFIFSGWSECPDVMPDEDVMVYGYFEFDAVEGHIIEDDGVKYLINGVGVDRFSPGKITITNRKKIMILE